MENIMNMLGKIEELSNDEIETLRGEIVTKAEELSSQPLSRETVDSLTQLADAAEALRVETTRRESELAELTAQSEAAMAKVLADSEEGEEVAEEVEEEVKADRAEEVEEEGSLSTSEEVKEEETSSPAEAAELAVEEAEEAPAVEEVAELAVEEPTTDAQAELASADDPGAPEVLSTEPKESDASESEALEVAEVEKAEAEEIDHAEAELADAENMEETVSDSVNEELNVEVPETHKVLNTKTESPVTITAGADIPGVTAGTPLPNLRSVAQALIDRRKAMGRTSGGDGEQHTVASFNLSFPESRTLTSKDLDGNAEKIAAVVSPEAITAAGGLLGPVDTSYDIFGFGSAARPVKDSLAVFGADRGGIRYVTSPVLEDLTGAVSAWTLENDRDAAAEGEPDPVKPCLRVSAGDEVTVYTDAIPLCLTFGNLGARAWPEVVERHTELGMVQHARFAETRLLTRIGTLSTNVTSEAQLGAARDIFVAVEQAAAGYRSRHRLDGDTPLRAIFPTWFKNALRADLTKQIPGDGNDDTFGLAEATINAWFAVRNINVTWAFDGETGQVFGTQDAGALASFPENVIWYLFSEGTFLFLDGGTLDLGIVRDSTLNGTNDYKIFLETFEGVAKVGIESLRVTTPLALYGASAATIATAPAADGDGDGN